MKAKFIVAIANLFLFNLVVLAQTDIISVDDYINELSTTYRSNPQKAFELLKVYLLDYEKDNNTTVEELESIYYGLALYSQRSSSYDSSRVYAKRGLHLLERNNIEKGKSGYYNILGVICLSENKLDSSAQYFVQCIKALRAENDLGKIPFVNNNIGNIYLDKEDYRQALVYFEKAYRDFDTKDNFNERMLAPIFGNMAYSYFKIDSIEQANKYANLAINLAEKHDQNLGFINGYLTKSDIAIESKKLDSAKFYALNAYKYAQERDDSYYTGVVSAHLAGMLSVSNPSESIKYGEIAYGIYSKEEERYINKMTKILSEAYFNNKDYENAAIYQKKYIKYQDSLLKNDYNKNTIDILEKYQAAQKELKINEQKLEINKKNSQTKLFATISFSLLVVALLLTFLFVQKRRAQKEKIRNLENEKENIALKSLMAGEEKERSRIAKELHDGIGSLLAASKMHASTLLTKDPEASETLISLLDNASNEARRISHNLLPESLVNKGLDAALRDFVETISEGKLLNVEYQAINFKDDLLQSTQLTIYRIIQELLNNIIKHSGATEAYVQLNQNDKKLIITVEDNGRGFSSGTDFKGIGLQNIESRLSLLNGKIEVASKEAMGTSVYIEFEIEK